MMTKFEQLIGEQMETMDKILSLQHEIELYQQIEEKFTVSGESKKLKKVREEIDRKKKELEKVHLLFDEQTEQLIRSYTPNTYA